MNGFLGSAAGATFLPSFATSPIGDTITLIVWTVLAVCAVRLLRRLPKPNRGAWILVAIYCTVVAIDKAVDLQLAFYTFAQWCRDALDPWLGLHQHRQLVRVVLLVPLTVVAVGGTVWLVRSDRQLDRGKKCAIGGLVVVLLLVGLRGLPGLGGVLDEQGGWVLEAVAVGMIGWGLGMGWRGVGRGQGAALNGSVRRTV